MTMIDDVLRQNWSTLHSLSIDLQLLHSAKRFDALKLAKGEGSWKLWIEPQQSQSPTVNAISLRSHHSITLHGIKMNASFRSIPARDKRFKPRCRGHEHNRYRGCPRNHRRKCKGMPPFEPRGSCYARFLTCMLDPESRLDLDVFDLSTQYRDGRFRQGVSYFLSSGHGYS
jgi:hypothetical protein